MSLHCGVGILLCEQSVARGWIPETARSAVTGAVHFGECACMERGKRFTRRFTSAIITPFPAHVEEPKSDPQMSSCPIAIVSILIILVLTLPCFVSLPLEIYRGYPERLREGAGGNAILYTLRRQPPLVPHRPSSNSWGQNLSLHTFDYRLLYLRE